MFKIIVELSCISALIYALNILLLRLILLKQHYELKKSGYKKNLTKTHPSKDVINIGLFTNELAPWVVYGGVATWIDAFISMFNKNKRLNIIPIFLAFNDSLPDEAYEKYSNLRIINSIDDINNVFSDIDLCVNNLWISLDTVITIKNIFPAMPIISVCHSLIRMEHITNMGSQYTENFNDQEKLFQNSDYIVLISNAEKEYYDQFGYNKFDAKTVVIYNSYTPKYDTGAYEVDYNNDNLGYIGRHVPRKRPELPLKAVEYLQNEIIKVVNMGVDYDKYDNAYWRKLEKEYKDNLVVIPFSTDKNIKTNFFKSIGIISIPGIYEPFGYTICEALDRGFPAIVQNIDGPKEIIEGFEEYVYTYEVDKDNYEQDIINFSKTLEKVLVTSPETRKLNASNARRALDRFRPDVISKDWNNLFEKILEKK